MNKIINQLTLMAGLMFLAMSCQEKEKSSEVKGIKTEAVSFSASVEDNMGTKTHFTYGESCSEMSWNSLSEGETITVNGVQVAMEKLTDGVAYFKGEVPVADNGYYMAVSCPGSGLTQSSGDGTMSFDFPTQQTYNSTEQLLNSIPMVAIAEKGTPTESGKVPLSFNNACSILSFNLTGCSTGVFSVSRIEISTSSPLLAGTMNVDVNHSPRIYFEAEGESRITLTCSPAVALSSSAQTTFYVMTPSLAAGSVLDIRIYNSDGTSCRSGQLTVKSAGYALSTLQKIPITLIDDYIDENGVNRGPGIPIDGVIWAPVNCGYVPVGETDSHGYTYVKGYPYGRLYQWGRMTGVGFVDKKHLDSESQPIYYDETYPTTFSGQFTGTNGTGNSTNELYFFKSTNWISSSNSKYWNSGTEAEPVKTAFDPCPTGWRIPTYNELNGLISKSLTFDTSGQVWTCTVSDKGHSLTLPVSGGYNYNADGDSSTNSAAYRIRFNSSSNVYGYYWSSQTGDMLLFQNDTYRMWHTYNGYAGSIRCVRQ